MGLLEPLHQRVDLLPKLIVLVYEFPALVTLIQVPSQAQQYHHFVCRSQCDAQKVVVLTGCRLPTVSFGDVRRHGHDRSTQLLSQFVPFVARKLCVNLCTRRANS